MSRIINTGKVLWDSIPSFQWWKYATVRTGSFVLSYFCINAAIILTLTLLGFTLGLAAIFGIIPLTVFLAIRLSGAISKKWQFD